MFKVFSMSTDSDFSEVNNKMVDIKSMNKEQYIAWRAEKVSMDVETITKMYNEFAEEGTAIKIPDVDLYVKKRFSQAFIKKDKGFGKAPTAPVDIIPIGYQLTNFGATNQYNAVMKVIKNENGELQSEDVLQLARERGFINEKNEPLFHGASKKKGEIIDLAKDTVYIFDVITKRLDKPSDYAKGTLTIRENKLTSLPKFFSVYTKVEASIGSKSTDTDITLYGDDRTMFTDGTPLETAQVDSLIENFYKKYVFGMSEIEAVSQNYPDVNATPFTSFVFTKACIADVNITGGNAVSNKLLLTDSFDEEAFADTWVPKTLPIDFNSNAQDVWVYGTVSYHTENAMPTINVRGLYVPEVYKMKEQPKPITPEPVEEVEKTEVETPKVEEQKGGFTF